MIKHWAMCLSIAAVAAAVFMLGCRGQARHSQSLLDYISDNIEHVQFVTVIEDISGNNQIVMDYSNGFPGPLSLELAMYEIDNKPVKSGRSIHATRHIAISGGKDGPPDRDRYQIALDFEGTGRGILFLMDSNDHVVVVRTFTKRMSAPRTSSPDGGP